MVAAGTGEVVRPLLLPEVLPTNQQTRLQLLTLIDSDVIRLLFYGLGAGRQGKVFVCADCTNHNQSHPFVGKWMQLHCYH